MTTIVNTETTEEEWNTFEHLFSIPRSDMVKVKNVYRTLCNLYIKKTDLQLWENKQLNKEMYKNVEVVSYMLITIQTGNKWSKCVVKD
jgi:hypothetical protein